MYANDTLFKFKKVQSPRCNFCESERHYNTSSILLKYVVFGVNCRIKIIINFFEIKDIILFGILDSSHGSVLLNYIILESKFLILSL